MRMPQIVEALPVVKKIACQVCGQVKQFGMKCEECDFPLISIQPAAAVHSGEGGRPYIFLPICPSTNARMMPVRMKKWARDILTDEARDYISCVGTELRWMLRHFGVEPITSYSVVSLWVILPRTSCDIHNYGKVLFDALEAGGLVFNDKYILPSYRGIWHDATTGAASIIVKP